MRESRNARADNDIENTLKNNYYDAKARLKEELESNQELKTFIAEKDLVCKQLTEKSH
jgi:hypothetical protein